jgi:hypothetical protein
MIVFVPLATRMKVGSLIAQLAVFIRQRNDPAPVPWHNNVEPENLNH